MTKAAASRDLKIELLAISPSDIDPSVSLKYPQHHTLIVLTNNIRYVTGPCKQGGKTFLGCHAPTPTAK